MTLSRAREAAAAAVSDLKHQSFDVTSADLSDAAIDAFLASLSEDGVKLVKREASDAMLIAGIQEWVMQGATPKSFGRNEALGTTITAQAICAKS